MAFMTWTDKLSVGVRAMDVQHTILFDTINNLREAMMKGQARTTVGEMLCRLLSYMSNHFMHEEMMMEKAGYPELEAHRTQHSELTEQVEEYIARFQQGDIRLRKDLAGFLSDWLKAHIQTEDQPYGRCLNQHGMR